VTSPQPATPAAEAAIEALMRAFEQGGGLLELRRIIEQLAELEAVDALCAIIDDQSIPPDLRLEVLAALSPFPTDATIALFLDELNASSRKRKQLAIETLGRWRVRKAAPALCEQFRRQKQTTLRGALIEALGQIGTSDALFVLQQWLREAPLDALTDDLARLARIPRVELLEQLRAWRMQLVPGAALDREPHDERVARFDDALVQLAATLRDHQREQLSPHRQQLEEGLF